MRLPRETTAVEVTRNLGPSGLGLAIPRALRHRVHLEQEDEDLYGRAVLVVGSDDDAARCARRLCLDNEVSLACGEETLNGMSQSHAYVLQELATEDEILLWNSAAIELLEVTEQGRCRVVFSEEGPASATFDDVVFVGDVWTTFGSPDTEVGRESDELARPTWPRQDHRRAG